MDIGSLVNDLKTKQNVQVQFRAWDAVERSVPLFKEFLELPDSEKMRLTGHLNPNDSDSHLGYRVKSTTTGKDNKQYVHFNPKLLDTPFARDRRVAEFMGAAESVYKGVEDSFGEFLGVLENKFPGVRKQFVSADGNTMYALRFLAYEPNLAGGNIARGHYDKGPWTAGIAESHGGFRLGTPDSLKLLKRTPGFATIFPSLQVEQYTEEGFCKPGWHDVIQVPGYNHGDSRWAIVAFCNPLEMGEITERETHNYKLPK